MHLDPILPVLASIALVVLLLGLVMHRLRQPHVITYLIVGVMLGPHVFSVIADQDVLNRAGSIGVLLLLFFVGMEISLPNLISNWRVAVLGTLLQILLSVACVVLVGVWFNWSIERSVLLGFVISLSSTAVVIKVLQEWNELKTDAGQDVIGILLVQDLAIIPMLIIINFMGGTKPAAFEITLQITGGAALIGFLFVLVREREVKLPFAALLRRDHEMQVFAALVICLGLALLTDLFRLSTALGAFIAGILISCARETDWVHKNLEPFHVVFVAFFFVSIGLLVDLEFLQKNWGKILLLVGLALVTNTFINAAILKLLGIDWKRSFYTGALLAQIGEFSFVLAAVGRQAGMISEGGYQMAIAVISLTLLLSPAWIMLFKQITNR